MTLKNQIMTITLFALIVGVVVFMFPATPTQAQDGAVRYRSVRVDNALTVGGNTTLAGNLTVVGDTTITGEQNFTGDATFGSASATSFTATTITATTIISQAVGFDVTGNGTVSAPAYTFASDSNTGIYRVGADNLGITAGGTKVFDCTATGCTNTGSLSVTGIQTFTGASTFNGGTDFNAAMNVDANGDFDSISVAGNADLTTINNSTGSVTINDNVIITGTLTLAGQTQSGAVRYGTSATYTSGESITHGFSVTPTMCIVSPARDITATVTITTTGFSWDTATRSAPIFWMCGK